MRIATITVWEFPYTVPKPYFLSGGRLFDRLDSTIVAIATDDGKVGLGEACPFGVAYGPAHALGVRAGVAELAPRMIGMDPCAIDRIGDMMDEILPSLDYVKTALDMACWDLLGQAAGMPVHALMGGCNGKSLPIAGSVSTGTPEEMVRFVEGFRAVGYKAFSIKVGGEDPVLDAKRVKAVLDRRKPGDEFLVDANRGWTVEAALRFAQHVQPLDAIVEAPCKSYRECLAFKRRTSLPISLDEQLTGVDPMIQALADDAADLVNIKTTKVGGLTKAKRIRDLCEGANIPMSIQETGGGDIAFAALCHLAQATRPALVRHIWDPRELAAEKTAHGGPETIDGHTRATDRPGLGVTLNADLLGAPAAIYR